MADYTKKTFALDATQDRKQIIDPGVAVADVTVTRLSAAAQDDVLLHFGEGKEGVELLQGWAYHINPPETGGIYITVKNAHAGESVKMLFGYARQAVSVPQPQQPVD